MIALSLLAAAALLVWPVPTLLAGRAWTLRRPALALALWQAIGLATGLAAIAAGLHVGLTTGGPTWARAVAILASVALSAYLLTVAAVVAFQTVARRRRHRALLDLVSTPLPAVRGGRLLESTAATAYCLPGLRPRMVVTSAAVEGLSADALGAVVAHELSHLRQHHDLVVLPFIAWQAAWPFLPGAQLARASVSLLIEALADDSARSRVGDGPLDEALSSVAMTEAAGTPVGRVAVTVAVRRARLGTSLYNIQS